MQRRKPRRKTARERRRRGKQNAARKTLDFDAPPESQCNATDLHALTAEIARLSEGDKLGRDALKLITDCIPEYGDAVNSRGLGGKQVARMTTGGAKSLGGYWPRRDDASARTDASTDTDTHTESPAPVETTDGITDPPLPSPPPEIDLCAYCDLPEIEEDSFMTFPYCNHKIHVHSCTVEHSTTDDQSIHYCCKCYYDFDKICNLFGTFVGKDIILTSDNTKILNGDIHTGIFIRASETEMWPWELLYGVSACIFICIIHTHT